MKVGIVNGINYPFTRVHSCFYSEAIGNGSYRFVFRPDGQKTCPAFPGYAIDLTSELLSMFGVGRKETEYIRADGFTSSSNGRGLIELLETDQLDIGVPEIAVTDTRYARVHFSNIISVFFPAYCFLLCGSGEIVKTSDWAIPNKIWSNFAIPALVSSAFFLLFSLRILHSAMFGPENFFPYPKRLWAAALNVVLSRPDKTFPGKVHSRFFSALLSILVLRTYFKAGLIDSFSPTKKFPFKSVDELADAIEEKSWRLGIYKSASVYMKLTTIPVFRPIRLALDHNPAVDAAQRGFRHTGFLLDRDSRGVMYMSRFLAEAIRIFPGMTEECMCHDLGVRFGKIIAFSIGNPPRLPLEKVNRAVERMQEVGIVKKLLLKYEIVDPREPPWIKKGVGIPFQVFRVPLKIYALILCGAAALCVVECASMFILEKFD